MKWVYSHPALFNFLDFLFSLSLADRVRREVLASVRSSSLLEIGVGSGKNMRILEAPVRVGVDTSLAMLGFTRKRFRDVGLVAGDALSLPIRDSSFDVCLFCYVLRGLSNPVGAVREALRVSSRVMIIDYDRPIFIPRFMWNGLIYRVGRAVYGSRDVDFEAIERLGASKEIFRYYGGLFRVVILTA